MKYPPVHIPHFQRTEKRPHPTQTGSRLDSWKLRQTLAREIQGEGHIPLPFFAPSSRPPVAPLGPPDDNPRRAAPRLSPSLWPSSLLPATGERGPFLHHRRESQKFQPHFFGPPPYLQNRGVLAGKPFFGVCESARYHRGVTGNWGYWGGKENLGVADSPPRLAPSRSAPSVYLQMASLALSPVSLSPVSILCAFYRSTEQARDRLARIAAGDLRPFPAPFLRGWRGRPSGRGVGMMETRHNTHPLALTAQAERRG